MKKRKKKSWTSSVKLDGVLARGIRTFREHADGSKSVLDAIQESLKGRIIEPGHECGPECWHWQCVACSKSHDPANKCQERLAIEEQLREQFKKQPLETIRVVIHSKGLDKNRLGRRVDKILRNAGVKLPWE